MKSGINYYGEFDLDFVTDILEQVNNDRVIQLAQRLVSIPSVTGQEGDRISTFVCSYLQEHGVETSLQPANSGRFNVCSRIRGNVDKPIVAFEGHLDTKPPYRSGDDAFSGAIREGQLHGRGAADMKAGLAAVMEALIVIQRNIGVLPATVIFGAEVGEEGGDWSGPQLVKYFLRHADMAIVAEPTSLELCVGERGRYLQTVTVTGMGVHSGLASLGANAIQAMARVIEGIYSAWSLSGGGECGLEEPSVNVWKIEGGGNEASVADYCRMWVDVRTTDGFAKNRVMEACQILARRIESEMPGISVNIAGEETSSVVSIPTDSAIVRVVQTAVQVSTGVVSKLTIFPAGSMASFLIRNGIPSVILGPGNLAQAHGKEEWVDIVQVVDAARIYSVIPFLIH